MLRERAIRSVRSHRMQVQAKGAYARLCSDAPRVAAPTPQIMLTGFCRSECLRFPFAR